MCKKIRFVSNNWSVNNRKRSSCMWEGNNGVVRVQVIKVFRWTWSFLVFFPVLNDGGPERLHVKGQAVSGLGAANKKELRCCWFAVWIVLSTVYGLFHNGCLWGKCWGFLGSFQPFSCTTSQTTATDLSSFCLKLRWCNWSRILVMEFGPIWYQRRVLGNGGSSGCCSIVFMFHAVLTASNIQRALFYRPGM